LPRNRVCYSLCKWNTSCDVFKRKVESYKKWTLKQRSNVCGHVCSDHKGRAIAVFGHRFCGLCTLFLQASTRMGARRAWLASLPQSRKSSSLRLLLPLPGPLVPSFQHGDSNKSTGFYSCLSDILYIAGPKSLTVPFFCPLPRLRTRAPYVINAGNSVYAQSIRSRGLQVRPHVRDLTYWTVYTLRVSMLRAVPRRHIRANRYKTLSFFFQTYHISLAD